MSTQALEVLAEAQALTGESALIFPGTTGLPIPRQALGRIMKAAGVVGTAHGFRSSFRDWCGDTGVARELAERALGHVVRNATEAAYARSDLLDRRRAVMQAWADYVVKGTEGW